MTDTNEKTYICICCRHKYTLTIQWMIDEIEKEKHAKICIKCQNKMWRETMGGNCVNCM